MAHPLRVNYFVSCDYGLKFAITEKEFFMKNSINVPFWYSIFGVIALVAIIGFSFVGCSSDSGGGGGGGNVSWPGTWNLVEDINGGSPAGSLVLTLGADGGAWSFVGSGTGGVDLGDSGLSWNHDPIGMGSGAVIRLNKGATATGTDWMLLYEVISSTRIKVIGTPPFPFPDYFGIYQKQ